MVTQRIVIYMPLIFPCVVVKEQSRTPRSEACGPEPSLPGKLFQVVGVTGFEPVTLRLSSACSNQLSYTPVNLVELRRLELLTYSLQSYRSTN